MADPPTVEDRLTAIEQQLTAPKAKDSWDKAQAILPPLATVVSGVVVAVVGYYLTGTLNATIQREQMQLANVKEMREQLQVLGSDRPDAGALRASAFTLSAYGAPAAPPLFAALIEEDLHSHGDGRNEAMLDALRAIGLSDSAPVCNRAARTWTRITAATAGRRIWRSSGSLGTSGAPAPRQWCSAMAHSWRDCRGKTSRKTTRRRREPRSGSGFGSPDPGGAWRTAQLVTDSR